MPNYLIFRNNRKKGGGGVLVYVKQGTQAKRLRIPQAYTTLEATALDVTLGNNNSIVLGISRPPRNIGTNYCARLKDELNSIHAWALSQRQTIITLGNLNLDRLKRNSSTGGKILIDLEDVFDLTCLMNEPTRVTPTSQTLVDVILTNKPESTQFAGVTDFGLSDHRMVYVFLKSKVKRH